jgi:branched-chain amino acid transport system ATP-binding protein
MLAIETPMTASGGPVVQASNITKRYGGVVALNGVSLTVHDGEVFGIIGPNGAGKSTLFDILCGITKPSSGKIEVLGHDVTQMQPHVVARNGLGRTFQRTAVFGDVSVFDNLLYGRHLEFKHSVVGRMLNTGLYRSERDAFVAKAEQVLTLCGLQDDRNRIANVLAYGVQRRLAVAITLMSDPKVLFLDEPAAGMNGRETADFVALVQTIAPGRTVVIVEHDMTVIKALCSRVLVVVDGRQVTVDAPDQVFKHAEVISAYLGADDE